MDMNALQQLAPAAPTLRRLKVCVENPEAGVEDLFPPLSNLTHLELNVPDAEPCYLAGACRRVVRHCCNLVELKLAARYSQVAALPGIIAQLTQLSILDLSGIWFDYEDEAPVLAGLGNLPDLSQLHLGDALLTEELEALSKCTLLTQLSLWGQTHGQVDFVLPSIKELKLVIEEPILPALSTFPNMTSLQLAGNNITSSMFRPIATCCSQVSCLSITLSPSALSEIAAEDMHHISKLPMLTHLELLVKPAESLPGTALNDTASNIPSYICSFSNAIITSLASCRGLLSLDVSDLQPEPTADADDVALVQLLSLQYLQQLTLAGFPALSLTGVAALTTLPRLTQLTVVSCEGVCCGNRPSWLTRRWREKHVEVSIHPDWEQLRKHSK
eukprot:jgi/Chrzof1/1708/Cz10g18040.t1